MIRRRGHPTAAPAAYGGAATGYPSLLATALCDYTVVRKAILDRLGLTPEGHRQRFPTLAYTSAGQPFAYAQELRYATRQWLQPGERTADQIVDAVVLDWFLEGIPAQTASWVTLARTTW